MRLVWKTVIYFKLLEDNFEIRYKVLTIYKYAIILENFKVFLTNMSNMQ